MLSMMADKLCNKLVSEPSAFSKGWSDVDNVKFLIQSQNVILNSSSTEVNQIETPQNGI